VIVGSILTPIEDVLTSFLEWLHSTVGLSWGWSIVALVVVVRMLILPLAVRQIHSMQNLQAHAPEMKEIQQRWKHDRQRQNEELMKFYKENKINPAASCLPILPQIPIFMSLFFVLRDFEKEVFPDYPGSSLEWLGLVDITEKTVKGWGPLLIAIYALSQLTSSFYMSTAMQSKAQRYMIMVLPIVFIPFVLNFASGLMIYWMTTNLWTTGQGVITRRLVPRLTPEDAAKRSSRTPPKDAPPPEKPVARKGSGSGGSGTRAPKAPPASGGASAGPPRRVRRKRGGGGGRR
jgi:YidC/Oxa1 family membrane protein insertase